MHNIRPHNLLLAFLIPLLTVASTALAQEETGEWEYLVVSYGTTYFDNPLTNADPADATYSKVQLFSDIGVTIPNEAIDLQRNIDVLGMFGWEMVSVVGSIGGDQQIVFKRPYDEERSSAEAERIRAEREEIIAAYNASNDSSDTSEPEEKKPQLVDVDAVERTQATVARNERDEATVRSFIETAAASGFPISDASISADADNPTSDPDVTVRMTQDVTAAALIAPGQYRKSLVDDAVEQFETSLTNAGLLKSDSFSYCGYRQPQGVADIRITAVIQHDGTTTEVGSYWQTFCFNP